MELPNEIGGRNEEGILLEELADDRHEMRALDVPDDLSAESREVVGTDDGDLERQDVPIVAAVREGTDVAMSARDRASEPDRQACQIRIAAVELTHVKIHAPRAMPAAGRDSSPRTAELATRYEFISPM
jgi:hypothetical protein